VELVVGLVKHRLGLKGKKLQIEELGQISLIILGEENVEALSKKLRMISMGCRQSYLVSQNKLGSNNHQNSHHNLAN